MSSYASKRAITDTGEEVILNDNGTWSLSSELIKIKKTIKINRKKFTKPKTSSFLLKSVKNDSAFWINTNKWKFKKATGNSDAEYELQLKGKDLYGMVIAEGIQVEREALINLAISNARNAAPDVKVIEKEYRTVNGKKIIYMKMQGTIQSIKFTYLGYYYSDKTGSTQLLTYTASNLVEKYKPEIFNLKSGLVTK